MDIRKGFVGSVGNTPMIRLNKLSNETGCEILGKAEFLNPGCSVKDRAALFIIKDAEERGVLKPGGHIVEGTAGNTGIAKRVLHSLKLRLGLDDLRLHFLFLSPQGTQLVQQRHGVRLL